MRRSNKSRAALTLEVTRALVLKTSNERTTDIIVNLHKKEVHTLGGGFAVSKRSASGESASAGDFVHKQVRPQEEYPTQL